MSDRDEQVLHQQTDRLVQLVRASRVFAEAVPDSQGLLKLIAEHVAEVTGDACTVRLLSEDGAQLRPVAVHHPDVQLRDAMWRVMAQTSERADIGLWRTVIDERRPVTVTPSGQIPPEASDAQAAFMRRYPLSGIVGVPLIARGRVLGAVALVRFGPGSALTSDDEAFLTILAERAALAIDNAHLLEQARTQLETWRALVENAPDIISRFDRDLRHLYVNPAIERATGRPAGTMIGKSNRELGMPEPLVAYWELHLEQVFRDGHERTVEFSFTTPMGERHYQARIAPELDASGSVRTVLAIARDITAQKRADLERSDLYRELLERDRRLQDLVSRLLLDRERDLRPVEATGADASPTHRERDVLRLLAVGLTNQQIGRQLGLSTGTVKNHIARLIEKFGVPDRTAVAVRAVQLGLVAPD